MILTGVVLFVLVPRLGALAIAVIEPAPRLLTTSERLPLVIASASASALLVQNVALAIFKPGWRLRSRVTSASTRPHTEQAATPQRSPSD